MESIINSKLPKTINTGTKDLIKESFYNAISEMGDEECDYICQKIKKKVEITKKCKISWVARLSSNYEIIFEIYNQNNEISIKGKKLLASALFYFINPFDIIPDFTPGIGYVDDFFVLKLCLKALNKKDQQIVSNYFKKSKKSKK